jgi:hypothetical protein
MARVHIIQVLTHKPLTVSSEPNRLDLMSEFSDGAVLSVQ